MTREEEIKQYATDISNTWLQQDYQQVAYDAAIKMAEWDGQHPRKGLWDGEKVIEWLDKYADSYTYFNVDKQETEFIGQMFEDLRKAMEE